MITPELVNYIQLRIAKGHHLDIIRKDLFAYGAWSHNDIDEAFVSIGVSEKDVPVVPLESSSVKTGENKDSIIEAQKNSYEDVKIQNTPSVNVDLGGDVSVSSEKENIEPSQEKDVVSESEEELSTVLDLDTESLRQAGVESIQESSPDPLNKKQLEDISLSSGNEEIAGISFENPIQDIEKETIMPASVVDAPSVVLPPVQPVDSFDPHVTPSPIVVKEMPKQDLVVDTTINTSSYMQEPTEIQQSVQEKKYQNPGVKNVDPVTNIKPMDSINIQKPISNPVQNFAKDWYEKSEPVVPAIGDQMNTAGIQASPAFGGMAITPDTQIYNDNVVIKKQNPFKKIIGVTVIILLILGLAGFGLYAYTNNMFPSLFGTRDSVDESMVVEIPLAEQALASLQGLFPVGTGIQFSYIGSVTTNKDIFTSMFHLVDDVVIENPESGLSQESDTDMAISEEIIEESLPKIPVESLVSIDGWLRTVDTNIQSEGKIIFEIPRNTETERVRLKFIIDNGFAFVFFEEISEEALVHMALEKEIWYRLPIMTTSQDIEILPQGIQSIAHIIQNVSLGMKTFSLQDPGTQSVVMNLPMYQYPLQVNIMDDTLFLTDIRKIVQNFKGLLSLRENTFIPYSLSGTSDTESMSVRHTLQFVPMSENRTDLIIPENVKILFPEIIPNSVNDTISETQNEIISDAPSLEI